MKLKVFDFLAIKEDIISNGTSLTKVELLNGRTLIPFQNTNSNLVENGNLPIVAMHRGRLLETLYSKLNPEKVHFNKRLESLSENNNNISLKFEDGSEELAFFEKHGEPAKQFTNIGAGPNGMTVKAASQETLDKYLSTFKK
mgnify:CR=1 FL=1